MPCLPVCLSFRYCVAVLKRGAIAPAIEYVMPMDSLPARE